MITLQNGHIQNQSGLVVPNGSVTFQLNTDAIVIAAPGGIIPADQVVTFQFDSSGNILPNAPATAAKIYSNAELQPQNANGLGTYYQVTFYDANGARINLRPLWWQFPNAANATVDISNVTPFQTIGGNIIFYPTNFNIGPPGLFTLGGVFSNVGAPHQWIKSVNTDGTVSLSQPAFMDISGTISAAQLPPGLIPTWNVVVKTGAYTAVAGDEVLADTSGGGVTIVLPAASANKGLSIRVKKISSDTNILTVSRTGADLIDGQASQTFTAQYLGIEATADGATNWRQVPSATFLTAPGSNKQILMNLGQVVSVVPNASAIKNLFWDDTVDGLVVLEQGIASAITFVVDANGSLTPGVACAGIVKTENDATNPTQLFCHSASTIHQGTGTVTKAAAYQNQISNSQGIISTAIGFWTTQPIIGSGAAITNQIGIEIDDQSKSVTSSVTPTNSWGIQIQPFSNSTGSFAIEVQGGKTRLTPNAIGDVALRVRKFSASQTAPAIEVDAMMQFDGLSSGSAQIGVASAAGTPNRLNLPIATAGVANAVLVSDAGSPQQASWLAPTGTAGSAVLSVSPALTGTPTAPTQAVLDNSTNIATTAYVDREGLSPAIVTMRDDFLSVFTPTGAITTTAQVLSSETAWALQGLIATGTFADLDGTFLNPGQIQLGTGATSGNGCVIFKSGSSITHNPFGALGSNAIWEFNGYFKLSQTATCAIRLGFCQTPSGDPPSNGIYMEYDTANTGNTDTKFTWVTVSGGTPTYSTTNAVNADTNFHRLRIRSLVAGTILFSIDGGTEASVNTNVPTVALGMYFQIRTRTAAAAFGILDMVTYGSSTGRV